MSQWWHSLSDAAQIFWAIAIASSIFQVLIFIGSLFSAHDFDHSPDASDGDAVEGVKLLSVRAIIAFLVGFGWAGGLLLGRGSSLLAAILIAVVTGVVFMSVIFAIMRVLMTMRADGTLNYANAIGQTGQTYVTIPANRSGRGQVEIMIQGRLTTAHAVTDSDRPISPQTSIVVRAVESGTLLVVSPAH